MKKLVHITDNILGRGHFLLPLCVFILTGLLLLSCIPAAPPTISVIPGPGPQQSSNAGNSGNTEFDINPAPDWRTVAIMSIEDAQDQSFFITAPEWRMRWNLESAKPEFSRIDILIYLSGNDDLPFTHITGDGSTAKQPVYIERGYTDFRVKVAAANVSGWTLVIEEPAGGVPVHPVQITRIQYRGHIYEDSTEEAPVPEADEYVEITNRGTEAVSLCGWTLRNISRGNPVFIFPAYFFIYFK